MSYFFLCPGTVRADLQPPAASAVPAVVPVPARVRVLDRHARLPVPLPLQRLLQGALQVQEGEDDCSHQRTLHGKFTPSNDHHHFHRVILGRVQSHRLGAWLPNELWSKRVLCGPGTYLRLDHNLGIG